MPEPEPEPEPEPPMPEPEPEPEPPMPEPEPEPEPEPPMPEPEPLPEPEPEPEPELKDPFKSDWPKYERPTPKPAEPGRAKDFFDEDFDNPRYEWDWLPSGVKVIKGSPSAPGALEVGANKMFQLGGNVASGEIRAKIWRDMDDADARKTGKDVKGYEIQLRFSDAKNYEALQIRGDGYYRIVEVTAGVSRTLVGDTKGDYLPIPRWDRDSRYDDVVVTFSAKNINATFNGHRLASTSKAGGSNGKVGIRTLNGLKVAVEKLSVDEVGSE